jgi:transposase
MPKSKHSRDFKVSAVKLVSEQGYTITEAAKSLGIEPNTLRDWTKKFAPAPEHMPSTESAMRAELRRLREENRRLTMERDILKKATAFFAKNQE